MTTILRILDKTSPELAARIAVNAFVRPRRWPAPEWEQALLNSAERMQLTSGHRGYAWGHGEPVLLVHGWEGRPTQLGHFVPPLVARGFRVVAFHAPAHGTNAENRLTVVDYARFLCAVATELGSLRGAIGHSLGASAIGFALPMGLTVERTVLISIADSVDGAARRMAQSFGLSRRTQQRFRARLENRVFRAPLAQLAVSRYAARFAVPALLMATDDDKDVPLTESLDVAANWPSAQMKILSGAGGHRKILRDRRTIDAAVNFIAQEAALPGLVVEREVKAA